ncbi:hypothetical protein [Pseudomonas sp.]|uniref:hypothetical protein n=1 Tax=Pseudomonas sp. TaxID=306 RepID=UPI003F95C6E0
MTIAQKSKLTAEQARQKYGRFRRALRSDLATLEAPSRPVWWPGEPQFAELVPRNQQDRDMTITVERVWEEYADIPGLTDEVGLEVRRVRDLIWTKLPLISLPGPIDPDADFPMALTLDKSYFSEVGVEEARFQVRYRVYFDNNTDAESDPTSFVIDTKPPHYSGQRPDELIFKDASVETDGITQSYLDANSTLGVPMIVPPYNDTQPGDTVHVYIANDLSSPVYEGPVTPDAAGDLIYIPVNRIELLDDGQISVHYYLEDKVGNDGSNSNDTTADLFLKPEPIPPLAAPRVPLAEDAKTLIDLDDLDFGVDITVKLYENHQPYDRISVDWGGTIRDEYRVGPNPSDPIVIPMPESVIRSAYNAAPGTGVEKATVVQYEVRRGNRTYGSLDTDIFVDLSYVGPVYPEDPDPVNSRLPLIEIFGGGPGTPVKDVLRVDDIGFDAVGSFVIPAEFDEIGLIEVYWGHLEAPVASTTVIPAQGATITFGISWADIEKVPGTLVPVYYTTSSGPSDNNPRKSRSTQVDVRAAVPIRLGAPEFPDADRPGNPILNCYSFIGPDQHVRVTIPSNSNLLKVGDSMHIEWQAYDNRPPATLNPVGDIWDLDIPSLTQTQIDDGFTVNVEPFLDHTEPVGRAGYVTVTYTALSGTETYDGMASINASSVDPTGTCPVNP